jgi:hypothetical protein
MWIFFIAVRFKKIRAASGNKPPLLKALALCTDRDK